MDDNKYKDSLFAIQNTIANCDNKAGVLLTALGIVFGFSLFSVQELSGKTGAIQTTIFVFGALYLLSFVASIIILVLIVCPRTRNKKEKNKRIDYSLYTKDLYEHSVKGDLSEFIKTGDSEKAILQQIEVCSRIAIIKEKLLIASVFSIVVFTLCLVALVICLFIK